MSDNVNQIESIFAGVVALPAGQRSKFLDAQCADAPQLRQQIDALLRAHDQANHLLDRPAEGVNRTAIHSSQIQHPGETIAGRYKLLEQIGVGGMGAVWMAEQKEPVKRKVAIKLVKAGMDSAQVLARFEAERQALALMDHPNIAKVFDGGVTDQGRPFFVMEFVKGVPLTEYCNEARLSLKERLNLFIPVCQAVQHAHQKGIIHRDLKPSNILICLYDGKPVPKVIDFGLAKAMYQSLIENTIHTAFGMMVGTPLYMSPEQAEHNNLDVDTRTDIYSLGVILYELLTGTTPLEQKQLKEAAYNEILRLIKEVEPPKPSTRLSGSASLPSIAAQRSIDPKQLGKSLSGDLDWIVMKALDKERSRRYETANALVREIHRYLEGQPVDACPPSTTYRVKKFVARNRASVLVAACFLLLVLGSSAVSWILFARANHARELAVAAELVAAKDRDRAIEAKRVAAANLLVATREKERADGHARELKQKLYDYNIIKANTAYRDKQFTTVSTLLAECLPEQRGWEWAFLNRLANAPRTLNLPGAMNLSFAVSSNGDGYFTIDTEGVVRHLSPSGIVLWSQQSEIPYPVDMITSPTGAQLLIVGSTKRSDTKAPDLAILQALNTSDGKILWTEKPQARVAILPSFSSDGAQFLVTTIDASANSSQVQARVSKDGRQLWSTPAAPIASAIFDRACAKVFISETKSQQLNGSSTIRCLNATDRQELWKIARTDETSSILLSPDDKDLIATGKELSLVLIDAASGELKQRYRSPLAEPGLLVQGCRAKNHFLTVSGTGHYVIWDWQSKLPIEESRMACEVPNVYLTPDGLNVAAKASRANTLQIRPTRMRTDAMTLVGHGSGYKGARFLDNEHLCSVGTEGAWRLWDTASGQELSTKALNAAALELDIASSGKCIAAATMKGTLLWDRTTGETQQYWPLDGQTWFVKFNATGTTLATAGEQGILRVYEAGRPATADHATWSTKIDRPVLEAKASASIHGLAIRKDGAVIYTLDTPGCEVLAWDTKTGSRRVVRPAQAGQLGRTAELSPDGNLLALGIEKSVEIWDVNAKRLFATLQGAQSKVHSLTFDRSGTRLFVGTIDGVVSLWNLASHELLLSFPAHSSYVVCLAMSPDNSKLVSTGFGGELKVWETKALPQEVLNKRELVQQATEHANQLLIQYKTPRGALEQLARDNSISEQLVPTTVAILQARMNAPVKLQALAQAVGSKFDKSLSVDLKLKSRAYVMKEKIDTAIRESCPWLLRNSEEPLSAAEVANWNNLARSLVQKSRFNLEPKELIALLQQIKEEEDAPQYVSYLKGMAHIDLSQWEAAENEITGAIESVDPKSPLWFVYAFRLSFLRAYVGKWDTYDALCKQAIENFQNSQDQTELDRLAKMCLFSNKSQLDPTILFTIADRPEAGAAVGAGHIFAQLTKGISELRRKNFDSALASFEAVVTSGYPQSQVGNDITVAIAKMYAAIACHQLGREKEASKYFEEAAEMIRSFPMGTGWWPDWMMAMIVMKEAEELIAQGKKEAP